MIFNEDYDNFDALGEIIIISDDFRSHGMNNC